MDCGMIFDRSFNTAFFEIGKIGEHIKIRKEV